MGCGKMPVEVEYIKLASHAIGLGHKKAYRRNGRLFYKPYRNYYAAGKKDCEIWDLMVGEGYAEAGKENQHGGRIYWLTRKGLDWLGEQLGIHIHDEED